MKVYRYWARESTKVPVRGEVWEIACFGSSNTSIEDATEDARGKVETAKKAIMTGHRPQHYEYTDRPLREEIKREYHQEGVLTAVITRNTYGALVLNTDRVMFIDIDTGREPINLGIVDFFCRLFGKVPKSERRREERKLAMMEDLRQKASMYGLGMRVYRTPYGYRCLVTSHTFDPTSDETRALLEEFGSDELYIKLCRVQECFRARLTPKPYRMRFRNPPHRYPWLYSERERAHREWEREYEALSEGYSACSFMSHVGEGKVLRDVQELVDVHDSLACTGGKLA